MKISYKWLEELTTVTMSPPDLAVKLTMTGLAVDSVEQVGDDYILDFDLTSNRPDGLSHRGIAREAAAVLGSPLRKPESSVVEAVEPVHTSASVEILDPDLCPRYAARVIRGVKVGPSPKWLTERLERIGQRPVNNIADITNYVMFEMGQPTHAFDLTRLAGQRIIVRRARPGEQITTLDGFTRELSSDMLVIADAERPVALAGIMGGEHSEISSATKDILLESAYFTAAGIRRTSRALGLDTEASNRFGRGADWNAQVAAADRVAQLIAEIAGGQVQQGVIDVFPTPISHRPVLLRESRVEQLSGLRVDIEQAANILRSLEFSVELISGEKKLFATAPSFRIDISREEDLVEEVVRHAGYDRIVATLPAWGGAGAYLAGESKRRAIRRTLAALGFNEAISFSFVSPSRDSQFRSSSDKAVRLLNPIDLNEDEMRMSLAAGLLAAVQRNFNYGCRDVKLFEIGRTFRMIDGSERPQEHMALALILSGSTAPDDWRGSRELDFYDLKGSVEAVLRALNFTGVAFERTSVEYLHPGQSAVARLNGTVVARLGRVHPRIASSFKLRQPVFLGEIDFETLLQLPAAVVRYSPLSRLPSIAWDVSALVPDGVSWAEIETAISELGVNEIADVKVFDIYKGRGVPDGMRSLAFRVTYRGEGRTLTDDEVMSKHERLREMLIRRFEAQLR